MAGVEVIWLVLLPAILACVVVLTRWAHGSMDRALKPRVCPHLFYMSGRCGQCGTPR